MSVVKVPRAAMNYIELYVQLGFHFEGSAFGLDSRVHVVERHLRNICQT
jgi:hypothetical protein